MKFYHAMFGFTAGAMFVVYGKGLPSECYWMVPGTYDEA